MTVDTEVENKNIDPNSMKRATIQRGQWKRVISAIQPSETIYKSLLTGIELRSSLSRSTEVEFCNSIDLTFIPILKKKAAAS